MDSRKDILIKERVSKIDDINFDKIFETTEEKEKKEPFEKEILTPDNIAKIDNLTDEEREEESVFSVEVSPNEFFDNLKIKKEEKQEKTKFEIKNKPLFFTITSVAVLLCVLFIYNLFVIRNLQIASSTLEVSSTTNVSTVSYEDFSKNETNIDVEKQYLEFNENLLF